MRADPPERRGDGDRAASHPPTSAWEDGDPRFGFLVARIGERLRPVCAGWDDARFQALVRQIARLKVRWGEADRPDQRHPEAPQ